MEFALKGNSLLHHQPCALCAKMLINAGIVRVVYHEDYPDEGSLEFLKLAGMEILKIECLI